MIDYIEGLLEEFQEEETVWEAELTSSASGLWLGAEKRGGESDSQDLSVSQQTVGEQGRWVEYLAEEEKVTTDRFLLTQGEGLVELGDTVSTTEELVQGLVEKSDVAQVEEVDYRMDDDGVEDWSAVYEAVGTSASDVRGQRVEAFQERGQEQVPSILEDVGRASGKAVVTPDVSTTDVQTEADRYMAASPPVTELVQLEEGDSVTDLAEVQASQMGQLAEDLVGLTAQRTQVGDVTRARTWSEQGWAVDRDGQGRVTIKDRMEKAGEEPDGMSSEESGKVQIEEGTPVQSDWSAVELREATEAGWMELPSAGVGRVERLGILGLDESEKGISQSSLSQEATSEPVPADAISQGQSVAVTLPSLEELSSGVDWLDCLPEQTWQTYFSSGTVEDSALTWMGQLAQLQRTSGASASGYSFRSAGDSLLTHKMEQGESGWNATLLDRFFQRDARRYDGGFSLY